MSGSPPDVTAWALGPENAVDGEGTVACGCHPAGYASDRLA